MVSGGVMVALGTGLIGLGIGLQMHNLAPYLWNLLLRLRFSCLAYCLITY